MIQTTKTHEKGNDVLGKTRNYNEVVSFLDSIKPMEYGEQSVQRMRQLDKLFGNISTKTDTIIVGGTNGKSSAIHFASKLLNEEGFKVGIALSSHILNYNERIIIDTQTITNKSFTDCIDEVITISESHKINATTFEILTIASLLHFKAENVDVALLEVGMGGKNDATSICKPKIAAVTRIAEDHIDILGEDLDKVTFEMLEIAKPGTWLISAEQSKIRLCKMKKWAEDRNIKWAMPIRKLAALPYIYEQLYGRTASLGERLAQIYVEDVREKFSPFLRGNLLATQRGQRGRPTLEAKRNAELNPIKTLKKFWNENFNLLRGRFELLDKEKPSILLDNADNLDAFDNVYLGIRLLHYQHPLKDFALIIGLNSSIKEFEAIKQIRYLLKKVSGQVLFVPLQNGNSFHNPQDLVKIAKEVNIKAKACKSFNEAFETAKKTIDEREGLVAITGSQSLITEYWQKRGIKKI